MYFFNSFSVDFYLLLSLRFRLLRGRGPHATDTTSIELQIATDSDADCRCSLNPGYPYGAMYLEFTSTDHRNHTFTVDGLYQPTNTTYFVRCRDLASGDTSSSDFAFPVVFGTGEVVLQTLSGTGPHPADVTDIHLTVQSDQLAELRISQSPGHPFESMYLSMDSSDGINHHYHIGGIYRGETTTYYIRSKSLVTGLITEKDYALTVVIDSDTIERIDLLETIPTHQSTSISINTPILATYDQAVESAGAEIEVTVEESGQPVSGEN